MKKIDVKNGDMTYAQRIALGKILSDQTIEDVARFDGVFYAFTTNNQSQKNTSRCSLILTKSWTDNLRTQRNELITTDRTHPCPTKNKKEKQSLYSDTGVEGIIEKTPNILSNRKRQRSTQPPQSNFLTLAPL